MGNAIDRVSPTSTLIFALSPAYTLHQLLTLRSIHIAGTGLNWTDLIYLRTTNCQFSSVSSRWERTFRWADSATNKTRIDDQRCWWRCVSLRQHVQVEAKRRGGWTQILGSLSQETYRPIKEFYPCTGVGLFGYLTGVISFEYQRDLWHQ